MGWRDYQLIADVGIRNVLITVTPVKSAIKLIIMNALSAKTKPSMA